MEEDHFEVALTQVSIYLHHAFREVWDQVAAEVSSCPELDGLIYSGLILKCHLHLRPQPEAAKQCLKSRGLA